MILTSLYLKALALVPINILQEAEVEAEELQEISPIMEPDPIPFTYETLGWKIVGVLILILLTYGVYKLYKKYQKNAYKREAIASIKKLSSQLSNNNSAFIVEKVSAELKKVAIISFGRLEVAALYGTAWLTFLQDKGKNTPFLKFDEAITNVIYSQKEMDSNKIKEMIHLSIKWIHNHAR